MKNTLYGLVVLLCLVSVCPAQRTDDELEAARKIYNEQGARQALPLFEHVLANYRSSSDRHGEAVALRMLGNCYKRLGERDRAIELLNQALSLTEELKDAVEQGKTLSNLGLVYWEKADYPKAISHLTSAIEIAHAQKNQQLEAAALNNLSLVYDEQGDYRRSLAQYQQALELQHSLKLEQDESNTLGNIGGVYLNLGRYREAAHYYEQSLAISERLKLPASASQDLGNLALCELALGQSALALKTLNRALAMASSAGQQKEEADWMRAKASAWMQQGSYELARKNFTLAVDSYQRQGLKRELSEALLDRGDLALRLGDVVASERDYRTALETSRAIGSTRTVALSFDALGELYLRRNQPDEAVKLSQSAQEQGTAEQKDSETAPLLLASRALLQKRDFSGAVAAARKALERGVAMGAPLIEAEAEVALGEALLGSGDSKESAQKFREAVQRAESSHAVDLQWQSGYGLGRALERERDLSGALAAYGAAIQVVESVRSAISEDRYRSGYFQDKRPLYDAMVQLLIRMGRPNEAFQYSERLRAYSYREFIDRSTNATDPRRAELAARIRRLQQQIVGEGRQAAGERHLSALDTYSDEMREALREYEELLASGGTSGSQQSNFPMDPVAIQATLGSDTAIIEYLVGSDRVTMFVVRKDSISAVTSEITAANLESRIELLRDLIAHPTGDDWKKPAASLYRVLIAPAVREGALSGVHHLILVPNGPLHYLPFAALLDETNAEKPHLVQQFALAYARSAASLVVGERVAAERSLLAMSPSGTGLPHAVAEVQQVERLFSRSTVLIGARATKSAFQQHAGEYRVIHIATHGYFNKLNPLLSSLQLQPTADDNGQLAVYEVLGMQLHSDLVTLSACETGLGTGDFEDYPSGDEFVGLTSAFLTAGSRAVVATLWDVKDRSTAKLIGTFYRKLQAQDIAGALADAQRSLLATSAYRHPFYWAAFVGIETQPFSRKTAESLRVRKAPGPITAEMREKR